MTTTNKPVISDVYVTTNYTSLEDARRSGALYSMEIKTKDRDGFVLGVKQALKALGYNERDISVTFHYIDKV